MQNNNHFLNFSIFFLSSMKALSMESLVLAPVKTTFPEANIKADLTCSICLQTTPGKFQLRTTFLSSHSLPMSILHPKSALATMLVTLKSIIFSLRESDFWMSLMDFLAACSASASDSDPIMIILPDLKTRMVLLGEVFLMMTAGNRFLLYLLPSTFSAIRLRLRSDSMFIMAKETTFCTRGRFECSPSLSIPLKINDYSHSIFKTYKQFFSPPLLWVSKNTLSHFSYRHMHQRTISILSLIGIKEVYKVKGQMFVLEYYLGLFLEFKLQQ